MRRARIADVAEAAGVSTATVSLVLNGRSVRVSDETRERVHQAAAHLGYTPNTVARGLRTQLTRTIGLISDEIATTPFAGRMFAGAQDAARENSHLLIMVNTDNDPAVEADAIAALSAQQVDAVIYAAMWHRVVEVPAGLPANSVLLDCRSESGSHPSIVPDEYAGAVLAVQALVDAGHQRIAYVDAAGDDLPAAWLRREAWRDVLLSSGLRIDETLHIADEISSAGGRRATATLLALEPQRRPTAVFCFNDRMALGAYIAARHAGLSIPRDLSVVGFDDQPFVAAELDPPLTTVALPHYEMGRWSVEVALGLRTPESDVHLMACRLVTRDSVAPPSVP
jgi:LacI family transcriptional regulator